MTRALRKTFLSLRNRNFRLYFIGQLDLEHRQLADQRRPRPAGAQDHRQRARGRRAGRLPVRPDPLLSAWAGAIADRSDKRRLLLVTQSLEMTQSIGLAVLAFLPHPPLGGLYALAAVGGILLAFDNPLRRSFVSEMVQPDDIPNAVVLYSTIVNVSRIFGPALAGLLVVTLGYGWCFTIDAVTYLAVLVCLFMMRPAELYRRPPRPRTKGEVRAGLRYVALDAVLVDQLRHAGRHRHAVVQLQRHPAAVRHRRSAPHGRHLHHSVLGLQLSARW